MAPPWMRFISSMRPNSCAAGAGDDGQLLLSAILAASMIILQPATSVATGFSVNTCLPALTAAISCHGRKPGRWP